MGNVADSELDREIRAKRVAVMVKLRERRENDKKTRIERKRSGKCEGCNNPLAIGSRIECEKHRAVRMAKRHKLYTGRRANGLCGNCGKPSGKSWACRACNKKSTAAFNRRYAKALAQGICFECKRPLD